MKLLLLLCLGASLGATSRWLLALWLNPLLSSIALGTWLANILGCLLIGLLIGIFFSFPAINAEWRLFLVTGFLGSFTTFSSFSGEVVEKLLSEKWLNALGVISAHLFGGLLCTALGIWIWKVINLKISG